jgi:hypothetical protein
VSSPILNIIWISQIFQNCICYYFCYFRSIAWTRLYYFRQYLYRRFY